jgi:RNase P/RNase MRP subunit p29
MSNRWNGQAGAHSGRFPLRALLLAVLVVIWMGAPGTARADTIVLQSGERIEGAIVDATRNTVVIRRAIFGMRQMPIRDIVEVRIELAQGEEFAGQLLGWVDGTHEVRSGSEVVRVRAGRILTRERQEEARPQPPQSVSPPSVPPRPTQVQTVEVPAPAAAAPEATPHAEVGREEVKPVRTGEAEAATFEDGAAAVAATSQAQSDGQRLAVRASVGADAAGADDLVFRIELSRPAERTVVLIYGTVDGTAVAGKDYEPQQGVVTLARGSKSADVRVPLIQDRRPREDARFELFLTADPKIAEVVDQRISATIPALD